MSKQQYSIKQLSTILGCSVTAISKKITTDENNPLIKRYRKRYPVVTEDNQMYILLDNNELEEEKRKSKGFKNVSSQYQNVSEDTIETSESEAIFEGTVIRDEEPKETLIELTKRYEERFEALHTDYFERLLESDKKYNLLTADEKIKDYKYNQLTKEKTFLELNNKVLKRWLYVLITLLIIIIISLIIVSTSYITLKNITPQLQQQQEVETFEQQLNVLKDYKI